MRGSGRLQVSHGGKYTRGHEKSRSSLADGTADAFFASPSLRGAGAPGAGRHRETGGRLHAQDRGDDHVHDRRSDVDAGRRLAGRADDPVRPARRSLHHADRRRRGEAHHGRAVVREPADLVAGRQDHRVPDRSHRRREPVDRRMRMARIRARSARTGAPTIARRSWCRRRGRPTATTSWCRSRGRPSRARSGCSCITATAARACASARRRRRSRPGCAGSAAAAADQQDGRRGVAGWPLHLLRAAHRHLHLQRAVPALADLPPRHRNRRRDADHQRARQRDPAGALARRQVDGVRHATQVADRPARAQPRDRRRAVARLSRDARRPGIARQPRHAAALRLHARRQVADRAGQRQAPAH